ncbi:ankyrin repeat-containing domain protein [Pilobolus umbonatus]|nr:ankyrin repeat-containing domain protein [Pilobolus umbonatus]
MHRTVPSVQSIYKSTNIPIPFFVLPFSFTLFHIMNTDHYKSLALPSVPRGRFHKYIESDLESQLKAIVFSADKSIQARLFSLIDDIVLSWTSKYNRMVDYVNKLEACKMHLEASLRAESINTEKATARASIYKRRWETSLESQRKDLEKRQSINLMEEPGSMLSSLVMPRKKCLSITSTTTTNTSNSSSSERLSACSFIKASYTAHTYVDTTQTSTDIPKAYTGATQAYTDTTQTYTDTTQTFSDTTSHGSIALPSSDHHYHDFDTNSATSFSDAYRSPTITSFHSPSPHLPSSPSASHSTAFLLSPGINEVSDFDFGHEIKEPEDCESDCLTYGCGDGFWNAIAEGKLNKEEVDSLISNYLKRGGTPNVAKNSKSYKSVKEGYSLLHAVIAVKNTSALLQLIDAGVKTNVYPLSPKVENRISPLVLAAKLGYVNGVRLLIEKGGADVTKSRGPQGEMVLHAAVQSNSEILVKYLLKKSKLLLDTVDNNGATPLHYACSNGKTRLVTLFIQFCHTKPDPQDKRGETPLHCAVRNQKLKTISKLVGDLDVNPNPYVLKQVPTPLELAKSGGLKQIANYLRSVGGKTTKEMEKLNKMRVTSSSCSTFSGNSSGSSYTINRTSLINGNSFKQLLHNKTSQILRGL